MSKAITVSKFTLNLCDQINLETIKANLRNCHPVQKLSCKLTCYILDEADLFMPRTISDLFPLYSSYLITSRVILKAKIKKLQNIDFHDIHSYYSIVLERVHVRESSYCKLLFAGWV